MKPSARIVSADNAVVKSIRALERDPAERKDTGLYVVWGEHLAEEALLAGVVPERLLISESAERRPSASSVAQRLARSGAPILKVADGVLESIVQGAGDQGLLLVVRRPARALTETLAESRAHLLVAHGIQDPGNVGGLARTALAFGAGALLTLEGCADPFSSRAARAAMGAMFRLPVLPGPAAEILPALRAAGLFLLAADLGGTDRPDAIDASRRTALIVGNEGNGLPPAILDASDARVRIPMPGATGSLNVNAAAAVLLYELTRRGAGGATTRTRA